MPRPVKLQRPPVPYQDRVGNYYWQTGRRTLTPRQRRRADHKRNAADRAIRDALKG